MGILKYTSIVFLSLAAINAQAQGLKLDSQVVLVNAADGEAVMVLKNTDEEPILLYTSVEPVEQDPVERILVTPPVARIEPGDSQLVRFILKKNEDLKTEVFARAIFEGIPPANKKNALRVTVRQNVPLIVHPKSLPDNEEPWRFLKFTNQTNGDVSVHNAGDYVVRMSPTVLLQPGNTHATLPRTYVLPGETVVAKQDANTAPVINAVSIKINPASLYGVLVDAYESPITSAGH